VEAIPTAPSLEERWIGALFASRPGRAEGLPVARTVAIDWACERAAELLSARLKTRVRVRAFAGAGTPRPAELAFGVELRGGGLVALDLAGARALSDSLAQALGGMRGTGDLAGTEQGLLESLALEVGQHLGEAGGGEGRTLRAILRGAELARKLAELGGAQVVRDVELAGRSGTLVVALPDRPSAPLLRFPEEAADGGRVTLTLALPPFTLQASEPSGLLPGDVVLLGATALVAIAGAELVTSAGWRLADARIARDSAGLVTVLRGALDPGDPHGAESRPGRLAARVTLGTAWLARADLVGWAEGAPLDLCKDGDRPGLLHVSGAPSRPIELVAVEGEIGARVLA